MNATTTAPAATTAHPLADPECRRSWMQDMDAPTCWAWITKRDIFRAEQRQLKANNALDEMHGRQAARAWFADPEGRNARIATLTAERDAAWREARALLAIGAQCTCTGPDMPR